jgi:hypothetical protein
MDISVNEISVNEISVNEISVNEISVNEISVNEISVNENIIKDKEEINPTFQVNLLNQYIHALIENIDRDKIPQKVNLIFDSGAVNGLLGIGAALYIHHLAKQKLIRVKKVSGCSIGSMIAVWYLCGCPDNVYAYMDNLFAYYKKHKNFYIFESIVRDVIHLLFPTEHDVNAVNGILYINYYDTKKHKQIVVSEFNSRSHLIKCILRSAHVPFITNTAQKCEERYIDGIAPYIFVCNPKCKNIIIKLINLIKPLEMINTKNERNMYVRLLRGLTGANEFFVNGNTEICSYVNTSIRLQFYVRYYFVLFIIVVMDLLLIIKKNIPPAYCEGLLYTLGAQLSQYIWSTLWNILV